jgi:hypothetical protein
VVARSETRNITDKAEEQGVGKCQGQKKAVVRHDPEALVSQHREELPFDKL